MASLLLKVSISWRNKVRRKLISKLNKQSVNNGNQKRDNVVNKAYNP